METHQSKPNYVLLVTIMLGSFFAVLCNMLMANAIPAIMEEFEIDTNTWFTTGYILVSGMITPLSAFLLNKYSIRNLFITSMTIFTIGTIIGGFAPNYTILISARIIQACGDALLIPLLMYVVYTSFPVGKRGLAMGFVGLILIFTPAIGPIVSASILEATTWQWLFHIIWPITLLITIGSFFIIKEEKKTQSGIIDITSVLFSLLGFGGVIYGWSLASREGFDSIVVIGLITVGILAIASFVSRQNHLKQPMLNFKIFLNPKYSLSIVVFVTTVVGMYIIMRILPLYMQNIQGLTTLKSGLILLPGAIMMGILLPISGKLYDRFGLRPLVIIGFLLMILTSLMLSNLELETASWLIGSIYTIGMISIGMICMPVLTNILNLLNQEDVAHGIAMNSIVFQTIGVLTSSVVVTIVTNRTEFHAATEPSLIDAAVAGTNDIFLYSIIVMIIGLIAGLLVKNKKKQVVSEVVEKIVQSNETSMNPNYVANPVPDKVTLKEVKEEPIPFQTVTKNTQSIPKGQKEIAVKGIDGVNEIVYEKTYIRGVLCSTEIISNEVVREPVMEVILIGDKENEITLIKLNKEQAIEILSSSCMSGGEHKGITYYELKYDMLHVELDNEGVSYIEYDPSAFNSSKGLTIEQLTESIKLVSEAVYGVGTKQSEELFNEMILTPKGYKFVEAYNS